MNAEKTIMAAGRKVVRAIKVDSNRRDLDGAELISALVALDVYRNGNISNPSLVKRFFSFIASIFRWNKSVKIENGRSTKEKDIDSGLFLMTNDGYFLVTNNNEKISIT